MATRRVLVIDNEANIREVIQACLSDVGGWDVLEAASGQEGLIKAAAEPLDAIILDPMSLGMDGFTFLKQLQTNPVTHTIPLVVLTVKAYLIQPIRFSQFGVMGAISKPFNPVTLPNQIATVLGWEKL